MLCGPCRQQECDECSDLWLCVGCVIFKKRPFQQVGRAAGWTVACEWQMPVMMA